MIRWAGKLLPYSSSSIYFQSYHGKLGFASSSQERTLKSSPFAQELGLEKQLKQVTKIQQNNDKKYYQTSSLFVGLVFLGCGTFLITFLIDPNRFALFKYDLQKLKSNFSFNKDKAQQTMSKSDTHHENNLKEIFNFNYKDRSHVDSKFLRYLDNYIQGVIAKTKNYNNRNNQQNSIKLSNTILQIIQSLADKFETVPDEKWKKNRKQLLCLFEKIVYHEFLSKGVQQKSLFLQSQIKICEKMAKFLLVKGDLNHQLLGLNYLQKRYNSQFPTIFSQEDITNMKQRLQINKLGQQRGLKSTQVIENDKNEAPDFVTRIAKAKQQFLYEISEIKQIAQIKKAKLSYLEITFAQFNNKMAMKNTQNKKK